MGNMSREALEVENMSYADEEHETPSDWAMRVDRKKNRCENRGKLIMREK